ncbi:unnamed protein product [Urochloa decumbens]|uniref:AIPP2-like SPOC-like domain-containing protein n=1 Tax=Urochloa decumbens TaxID=240449 RepID=A0ABC9GMX9_9POAL
MRRWSRFRSKRMNKIAKDMEKRKAYYMPPNMVKRNDRSGVGVTDDVLLHSGKKTCWGDREDQNGNIPPTDSYVSIARESFDVLPVKKNGTNKANQSLSHISKNAKQSPTSRLDDDLIPLMDIKSSNPSRVKVSKELENLTPLRSKDGSNAKLGYRKQSRFGNRSSHPIDSDVMARSAHQARNVDASNNVNCMRKKKEEKLMTYDDGDSTRVIRQDNLTLATIKKRRSMSSNEDGDEVGGCKKNMTDSDGTNRLTRQEKGCVKQQCNYCLKPISKPPWSGIFRIDGKEYISLAGHLSTKSCEKVWELSKSLPPVVEVEMVSRLVACPRIWNVSKPSNDNIGLYFLPPNMRRDEELDQLVNKAMENDLLLRAVINEAEMLVFPSVLLPKRHQTFQGKYYLWAVFEPRQR